MTPKKPLTMRAACTLDCTRARSSAYTVTARREKHIAAGLLTVRCHRWTSATGSVGERSWRTEQSAYHQEVQMHS